MDLAIYTLKSLAYIVVQPSLILMLVIVSILFYYKNKKLVGIQKLVIGCESRSALEITLAQIAFGMLFGILVSLVLMMLGITFNENSGIEYLFLLSILMTFIRPRFVCFSYSGAVLGLIGLIVKLLNGQFGFNIKFFDIDILCLMTFVGVMHILEGFLVIIDGEKGSIPVFSNKDNKIVGGYAFSRYWLVPIAIFIAVSSMQNQGATVDLNTPAFWPILKTKYILNIIATCMLSVLPFFGVIGFSTVTFTKTKQKKIKSTGAYIIGFGIILSLIAQICRIGVVGEVITVILAPLLHEFMLRIQNVKEDKNKPLFYSEEHSICVLEVIPYSEFYAKGIVPGDRIIKLNGEYVQSEKELYNSFRSGLSVIELEVLKIDGEHKIISIDLSNKDRVKILFVPIAVKKEEVVSVGGTKFSDVLDEAKQDNQIND
ncbi:signal protein PDZ [Clostridium sp. MSJ-8]|uniref:signal protein PDZ n=1 Tax=Clostridium sp. MSJ-8 TaxID=2841510 RepID=UPI001C0F27E4|nr:signal protein PDZ [Clostridium sp. MSJ-8]MBU5488323.1 signal protein PDZ [Clostridium sp. MSJ-8]